MKKLIFLSILLTCLSYFAPGQNVKTFEIMTSAQCEMCKERLESNIAFEKGIRDVYLDLETKKLKVTFKSKKTNLDNIRNAIAQLGYDADDVSADPESYKELPLCCQKPKDRGSIIHH